MGFKIKKSRLTYSRMAEGMTRRLKDKRRGNMLFKELNIRQVYPY